MRQSKLIILRGPSGSGKTTVATLLFNHATRKTALIQQDHYRTIFKPPGGGNKHNGATIHKMIKNDTLIGLSDGYDVILEGILSVQSYGEVLEDIFAKHAGESYMFYFDISLDETLRRHKTREVQNPNLGKQDMREWYPAAHRSNHPLEQVIPETFHIEETVTFIRRASKL